MTTKVVSLETAKRLKEAGWPQDINEKVWFEDSGGFGLFTRGVAPRKKGDVFSAPDVSDLLEVLPKIIHCPERDKNWPKGSLIIRSVKDCREIYSGDWVVGYENGPDGTTFDELTGEHDSLAEALASLWLILKENKIL